MPSKFPIWKQNLQRSLHVSRSKHEAKYFQLASIDCDGNPAVRTVVFRGFAQDDQQLFAVTDKRSDKFKEFTEIPKAQICWYFAKTREQYRLAVDVELLDSGCLVESYWNALSVNAKQSFFLPHPKVEVEENHVINESPEKMSEHFCLLRFTPHSCDYLNLKASPQLRTIETYSKSVWTHRIVNA